MDCIFCKIVDKLIPSEVIYEDNHFLVFKDIFPKSSLHILIIPKKHIFSVNHLEESDREIMGDILLLAKKMAKEQGVSETGYRIVFNTGKDAGQTVDHLHLHLMGGEKLPWA